ncbi:MAG: PIN domain-containing protein [Candidatus Obscuribacterales bacterium]|nr:PIN domain-containing protein [Candidatus Obscuribacterales bacterium]
MKVLVDTSVWSLVLRRGATVTEPEALQLRHFISSGESIFLIGVILQEILQGIRNHNQFVKLGEFLSPFPLLELDRDDYTFAAEIYGLCRNKGIQASTIDFLIAAAAIRHECLLLTTDKDFKLMASLLPLQIWH